MPATSSMADADDAPFTYSPNRCVAEYGLDRSKFECVTNFRGIRLLDTDVFRYEWRGRERAHFSDLNFSLNRPGYFLVSIPVAAGIAFARGTTSAALVPGTFALLDMSSPFRASIEETHCFSAIHLRIP